MFDTRIVDRQMKLIPAFECACSKDLCIVGYKVAQPTFMSFATNIAIEQLATAEEALRKQATRRLKSCSGLEASIVWAFRDSAF
jgi:hypothetical protein